jgi:hypothetical protein
VRRWFAPIAAALAAFACHRAENVEVPVTMTLDTESCTTDAPDFVELTCPTAVGVALWGDRSQERLEEACLDLPGTDRTLEVLPALLEDLDLSTSGDEPVRLEIGLFAPRAASDGCPDVSEQEEDMLIYGDSEPTDLATSVRGLAVTIVCVSVESSEVCYTACDDAYNGCTETGWCQQTYDACSAACASDADCLSMCQSDFEACMVDECSSLDADCRAGCDGRAGCDARCDSEHDDCLQYGACDARYDTCLDDCDTAPPGTCATVY